MRDTIRSVRPTLRRERKLGVCVHNGPFTVWCFAFTITTPLPDARGACARLAALVQQRPRSGVA